MFLDGLEPFPAQNVLLHVHRGIGNVQGRARFFVRLVQAYHLAAALDLMIARVVHGQIGGDAVKPGGELGFRRIALARAINAQKNFLRQLFRQRLVAAHAVHEGDHRPVILVYEILVSRIIIGAGAEHDLRIA